MDHGLKAAELFLRGYNCAQAVVVAFGDVTGLEEKYAARLISSFGGGMGRMREVCGAVSGMLLVAGLLYGYFNGCGHTTLVMVQGIVGAFCVRIPVSFLMSHLEPVSLFKIGLATPCSTIVQILICGAYFMLLLRCERKMGGRTENVPQDEK